MQAFDTLTLFMSAILLIVFVVRPVILWTWRSSLLAVMGISLLAHLILEGVRWQMVPAYVVILAMFVLLGMRVGRPRVVVNKTLMADVGLWVSVGFGVLLLSSTALLSYAFPVFELANPKGSFAVGTAEWHLQDDARAERYTADTSDVRELMVRIWYPAESIKDSERAYYWNHVGVRSAAVTASTPLPWFAFTHLGRVATNSFWNAPIATAQALYPVVLYSHGTGIGWESANTHLAEALASQGFIVVGINHSYIGSASIFPDRRVVLHDPATAAAMSEPPPPEIKGIQQRLQASEDWQEQIALYQQAMSIMPPAALAAVGRALDTQSADQVSVLDQLARMQSELKNPIAQRMNLGRVGLVGMSLGGSAAFETCTKESRCTAGVNLDGFHPRHIARTQDRAAFLYIHRQENLLQQTNIVGSSAPAYAVSIPGATHFNFFDFSIMSPLYQKLGLLGPIDGKRVLDITATSILSFFNIHLKGQASRGWAAPLDEFDEVELDQRNAGE